MRPARADAERSDWTKLMGKRGGDAEWKRSVASGHAVHAAHAALNFRGQAKPD